MVPWMLQSKGLDSRNRLWPAASARLVVIISPMTEPKDPQTSTALLEMLIWTSPPPRTKLAGLRTRSPSTLPRHRNCEASKLRAAWSCSGVFVAHTSNNCPDAIPNTNQNCTSPCLVFSLCSADLPVHNKRPLHEDGVLGGSPALLELERSDAAPWRLSDWHRSPDARRCPSAVKAEDNTLALGGLASISNLGRGRFRKAHEGFSLCLDLIAG